MVPDASGVKLAPAYKARSLRRFVLRLPVHCRLHGEQTWRSGATENVSGSGMLFLGQTAAKTGSGLEVTLPLSPLILRICVPGLPADK